MLELELGKWILQGDSVSVARAYSARMVYSRWKSSGVVLRACMRRGIGQRLYLYLRTLVATMRI